MFSFNRPTAAAIEQQVAAASRLSLSALEWMTLTGEMTPGCLPVGFSHDRSRTQIGQGEAAFSAAVRAFEQWVQFDLGWVRVANPTALVAPGQAVAVEARTLGLWSLNLSRIVETVRTSTSFGFVYYTTPLHAEQGEERFLLEFDPATGGVWYELEAVSRPRSALARLGFPVARAFQHRFARDSHRCMMQTVQAENS